jgi:hypothetical protein
MHILIVLLEIEILFVIIYDKIFDFHSEHLEKIFEVLEEVIHDYYSKENLNKKNNF